MASKKTRIAIAYDFDGTLAPGNMQEHSFLPELGLTAKEFWPEVKQYARDNDMDEILAYMYLMLKKATASNLPIKRDAIEEYGRTVTLFPGVEEWFDTISQYGKDRDLAIEHYIISSGLREMIKATPIGKKFKYIFASGYMYDANDVATWPALAVNYTTKTQYLFRINKGIDNSYDNTGINKYTPEPERPIPFKNIIYLGDGDTDIPCMKMLKYQGGHSIAVYESWTGRGTKRQQAKRDSCYELLDQERADYVAAADYSRGTNLDNIIRSLLDKMSIEAKLTKLNKP